MSESVVVMIVSNRDVDTRAGCEVACVVLRVPIDVCRSYDKDVFDGWHGKGTDYCGGD